MLVRSLLAPRLSRAAFYPLGVGGGRVGRFVGVDRVVRNISRQWKNRGFVLFLTVHATLKRIPPYYRIAAIPFLSGDL